MCVCACLGFEVKSMMGKQSQNAWNSFKTINCHYMGCITQTEIFPLGYAEYFF